MTEHTPGPLRVMKDGVATHVIRDANGFVLGLAHKREDAVAWAAAPDLLAACEYLTTLFVEGGNGEGWTLTEAYDRASEAIKKARGES